ncbi:1,4-alpha-glucan branching protein GlgB [candidate division KSB1 bacterium]|nr:1,4-alpha-glucan branching protein GlgB [candidate division KSB1 bacterium]RQW01215.1 MAG: 1,4-alpha-glucan branching protein GlgB [candidate division KSB1 bacterium]
MNNPPSPTVTEYDVEQIAQNLHHDPFHILGPHKEKIGRSEKWVVRAWLPDAHEVYVREPRSQKETKMQPVFNEHFFEAIMHDWQELPNYQYRIIAHNGHERFVHDSYFFLPQITDEDMYLFGMGDHHKIYEKLGAHLMNVDGVAGVNFAVWAPNARNVSVIGDFNQWHGGKHQMRVLGSSGIWELFIPHIGEGEKYKYEIKDRAGTMMIKSDPYGFFHEVRPNTASIVYDINAYEWHDAEWLNKRRNTDPLVQPISVYEVHLGSWRRDPGDPERYLSYQELAEQLVEYVLEMGYTHIELLPVAEHPFDGSWGYQVTGYYAPTSRYGAPRDFQYFVDYCHQHGIGVIIDWVPAHFPKDAHSLARFDGSALYEHQDARLGEHRDWGTLIFNYGRNEVRNFLIANALFWFDKYHVDGIRVDAVASMLYLDYSRAEGEWIPNEYGGRENLAAIDFIKKTNELIFGYFPGALSVAEESTAWPGVSKPTYLGGLGFNIKWNMGWMNDFLTYFSKDPIYRRYHHNMITFALLYAFNENFMLVLSHDEVVHGKRALLDKMPGDFWQKFANLRTLVGFMFGHPGKKLLFQGAEFGQWQEWRESQSLDWHLLDYEPHQKLQKLVKDLNHLYRGEPALHQIDFEPAGFEWIDFMDADNSIISFMRKTNDPGDTLVFVCNFTPMYHERYRIGVPFFCNYREILNTDAELYGGSNKGNAGAVHSDEWAWHNKPHSLNIQVPPLATVIFKPEII